MIFLPLNLVPVARKSQYGCKTYLTGKRKKIEDSRLWDLQLVGVFTELPPELTKMNDNKGSR